MGYDTSKKRALAVLRQKKMYEQQRDKMMEQAFSVEHVQFTTQQVTDSVAQVKAMKAAHQELQRVTKSKELDLDSIDKMQAGPRHPRCCALPR